MGQEVPDDAVLDIYMLSKTVLNKNQIGIHFDLNIAEKFESRYMPFHGAKHLKRQKIFQENFFNCLSLIKVIIVSFLSTYLYHRPSSKYRHVLFKGRQTLYGGISYFCIRHSIYHSLAFFGRVP
jgi:hypothetical protein